MITLEVNKLEIIYKGNGHDGFPTWVLIDGKHLSAYVDCPGLYDKTVTLRAEVGKPLEVLVETSTGLIYRLLPKEFDFTLGELRVTARDDCNPCSVCICTTGLKARTCQVYFAEGEAVWISVSFLPTIKRNKQNADHP